MQIFFFAPLISHFYSVLPASYSITASSPAYLDLLKLIAGSVMWFGGLIGFMYWRQFKLRTTVNK